MNDLIFTHIYERALRKMGISADEYRLCNYAHVWASYPGSYTPGWCNRTLDQKAEFINITKRGVTKMQNRLIEIGLMEKKPGTALVRATKAWFHAVNDAKEEESVAIRLTNDREQSSFQGREQSSLKRGTKVPPNREQSSSEAGNKVPSHNESLFNEFDKENIELIEAQVVSPVETIVEFMNQKIEPGQPFRATTKATIQAVNARLKEKWTVEDILLVIEHKTSQWKGDLKMAEYLRPSTLFGTGKFEGYVIAAKTWERQGKPVNNFKNGTFNSSNLNGNGGTNDPSVAGAFAKN